MLRYLRNASLLGAMYFVLVAMILMASGTACTKNTRAKTIHGSVIALDAARDGFLAFDKRTQERIVEKATSREDAEAKLVAYYKDRTRVVTGFELAYRALAVAATQTDEPSLTAALQEAAKLLQVLASFQKDTQ